MTREADWFSDPATLLGELRKGSFVRPGAPQIAGYDEVEDLRRGGQGVVYTAVQRSTQRRVAIKVLFEDALSPHARRRRFEREIELVSALEHSGIVRVYDSGSTADGRLYFVMEFVDGMALDEYARTRLKEAEAAEGARQRRREALRSVLELFASVCDVVHYAHQRGVIHRDLKPSNILVDRAGMPRVLDFGVARPAIAAPNERATLSGHFLGTLQYASPEQLRADPALVDLRSDVYALGVILYEVLCGRLPHPVDGSIAALVRSVTEEEPGPPSRRVPAAGGEDAVLLADEELDAVALKALAKDPERRYQSAAALAEDLRRYLRGEPIEAKRDSARYVLFKTLRRHKLKVATAVTFFALLVAFGVAMSLLWRRASLEARKAQEIRVFLEDTLGSVQPSRPGEEVTVREVLDEAVHWIRIALSEEPEVAASIRITIGNSFRSLGLYERAGAQLVEALETHRRHLGSDHIETARSLNALGLLRRDQGRLDEAEDLFRQALAIRERGLGARHAAVASTLQNLADVLWRRRDLDRAEELFRRAEAIRAVDLGEDHPDTAMARFQLAAIAAERGDLATAASLHRAVLATRRARLHREHPDIARSLLALGEVLLRSGDPTGAQPLVFEACRLLEEERGSGDALTQRARELLEEVGAAAGKRGEAQPAR
jgi:tetratricopeptide (TPR) repeat protein/tRNA A-37 threonylcarbamoyl transferase component Bud32